MSQRGVSRGLILVNTLVCALPEPHLLSDVYLAGELEPMSTTAQEPSTRRVMWWARSFGRPLQSTFSTPELDIPEEFSALLEMADERVNGTRAKPKG